MKTQLGLGVTILVLVVCGCAGTYRGTQSTSRSYNGANFNGEWKLQATEPDEKTPHDPLWLLPSAFRIRSDNQTLKLEDDTGTLIAEVALDSDYPYASANSRDLEDRPRAHWTDARTFSVAQSGGVDQRVTRTFTLDSTNRQLQVTLEVLEGGGSRSFTRTYRRI